MAFPGGMLYRFILFSNSNSHALILFRQRFAP